MPVNAQELGQAGEQAAAQLLQQQGYELLYHSYRHGRAEVDLVMRQGPALLVLVEVKTRSGQAFGAPETFVSARKQQLYRQAADQLQEELAWVRDIRFDIIAATPLAQGFRLEHFEDAFF